MLTIISAIVIGIFVLLYVLIRVAANQSDNFARVIVKTSKNFENEESFSYYFLANSGIFVAGVIHRPSMALYSSLYSLIGFGAIFLAILNLMNKNWILLGSCIIIVLRVFFSKTGRWFIHVDEKICKQRTLHNWLSAYPSDFSSANPLKLPPPMYLSDYYDKAFSISRRYFFDDKLEKLPIDTPHETKNNHEISTPNGAIHETKQNQCPPAPTGTIQETINNITISDNPHYEVDCDDNIIVPLYADMLKKRYKLTNGPFNNTYFNIILDILREKDATVFDEYNNTNRYFNFWNYSEEKDELYSMNPAGLSDDSDYALTDHLLHKNVDSSETRYAAVIARKQLHDKLLPFVEIYTKIRDMNIANVREQVKVDRKILNQNSNQSLVEAEYEILIHIYYSFKEIFKLVKERIDSNSIQGMLNDLVSTKSSQYSIGAKNNHIISMYSALLERRGIPFKPCGFETFYIHFFFEKSIKSKDAYKDFLKSNKHFDFKKYNEFKDQKYFDDDTDLYDDPDYHVDLDDETIDKLDLDELDYISGDNMFDALSDRVLIRDMLIDYVNLHDELADLQVVDIQEYISSNNDQIIRLQKEADDMSKAIFDRSQQLARQQGGDTFISMNYSPVYEIQKRINSLNFKNDFLIACDEIIHKKLQ